MRAALQSGQVQRRQGRSAFAGHEGAGLLLDNGNPPTSLNDLVTRPGNATNWNGPYAKPGDINDPFNHPFLYKAPGDHGDFDIIFLGKDGAQGGDGMNKDYGNWE